MAKQTIRTNLNYDWMAEFSGCTVREVIGKLQEFDYDARLEEFEDWDGSYGELWAERLETDDEYDARMFKEAIEAAERERQRLEYLEKCKEQEKLLLKRAKDEGKELYDYLASQKGNPNLSVLSRMFEVVAKLQHDGLWADAEQLRKVMLELEIK